MSLILLCDVQERFQLVISGWNHLVDSCSFVLQVATLIGGSVYATEQYPKGLGKTVASLRAQLEGNANWRIVEKNDFSMLTESLCCRIEEVRPSQLVLVGLETHVCVLQTCVQLLESYAHIPVYVVVDAVASSRPFEREVALRRLAGMSNVRLTTCESLAFELMGSSKHPAFKEVSALVKARSARLYGPATGPTQAQGSGAEGVGVEAKRIEPVLCSLGGV